MIKNRVHFGDAGYIGETLDSGWRFTASNSPWRTPIGSESVDAASDAKLAALSAYRTYLSVRATAYTAPVHVIDSAAAPVRAVNCPNMPVITGFDDELPVPSQVWADPSLDSHIVLYYPDIETAYEFWHWAQDGSGGYTAGMGGMWLKSGPGYNDDATGWKMNGAVAAKIPIIAGLIRYEEFAAGEIEHALLMVIPGQVNSTSYKNPVASYTDGDNSGSTTIKEGQRMRLKSSYDFSGLNAETQKLCRCLRDYGAYVMDQSDGGWAIKAQNYSDSRWTAYTPRLDLVPYTAYELLA